MFSQAYVSQSVHNRPHGYSVTAHPCYGVVSTHPTGMLSCYVYLFDVDFAEHQKSLQHFGHKKQQQQ